jgi:prepilin-type N-terminal cleavage/methylation domain-containing protein
MTYIIAGIIVCLFLFFVLYEIGGIHAPGLRKLIRELRSSKLSKKELVFDIGAWQRMQKGKKALKEERRRKLRKGATIMKYAAFISAVIILFLFMNPGTGALWKAFLSAGIVSLAVFFWVYRKEIAKFFRDFYEDFRGFRNHDKGFTLIEVFIVMAIVLIIFFASFQGFLVDNSIAVRALEKQGFQQVEITDRSIFFVRFQGCGGSDAVKFSATALNPIGKKVEVFVCVSWPFKGATIRTD